MELRRSRKAQRSFSPSHTSLMLACRQESKQDVKIILERQPGSALQRDRTGKNALHYCAENSGVDCASRLLSAAPALLNIPDDEGYTPLHLAVISGNKCMVKYMLTRGADSRATDSEKHSCVHWATVSGDPDCLDLLISAGADPSTPDIHGAYPVHYAAQMCGPNSEMGNDVRAGLAVLRKLLSRGVDVACVDRDGRPPLLWAASGETRASKTYCPSGSSDAILALVKAGSDVNAADRDGLTALHCAASRGHVDCLETLITLCGAEVDKVDDNGCSALFYAVTLGHADCTNLLLNFGANPNRQDNKGRTPAHCGGSKGQMETLKILALHKANLWLRNGKGDMPLHEAVQSGRKDLVEWLLKQHQGSVNVSNSNGRTPLHIAAITNNVDMCKILMDYGAFINPIMRNSKGHLMTPLDAALHRSNRSCAKYLNLHGAFPASKLLEKREYNRFPETQQSDTLELSPNAKRRPLRDSSAQTEPQLREVEIQARVDQKSVAASTERDTPKDRRIKCTETNIRCPGEDGSGKPIIAKVYVHTKRSRIRRLPRKPTAHRRDVQGEKIYTCQQQRLNGKFQCTETGASNNLADSETPQQTDHEKDVPSRKASQPTLYEDPAEAVLEEDESPPVYQRKTSYVSEGSIPIVSEEDLPIVSEGERPVTSGDLPEGDLPALSESDIPDLSGGAEFGVPALSEADIPVLSEDDLPIISEGDIAIASDGEVLKYSEGEKLYTFEGDTPNGQSDEAQEMYNDSSPVLLEDEERIMDQEGANAEEEVPHEDDDEELKDEIEEQRTIKGETEVDHPCDCYASHENDADSCSCSCHGDTTSRSQLLSVEHRRRSSVRPHYDNDNQSPLSSIRSFESTVKDSGFSDDVDRFHRDDLSSSSGEEHSDPGTGNGKRTRRHIARYIVSSGLAESYRLEEDEEDHHRIVVPKPRSSSVPHLRKNDRSETCPRLLNRPTLTRDIQKSLKKYQMERRLFYELQELKRKQITATPGEERETVIKMVERFRDHVLSPFMSDFHGPFTFRAFEKYLYEQLRKLSMGGKIPKPRGTMKEDYERSYVAPIHRKATRSSHVLCTCKTHKCHHRAKYGDTDISGMENGHTTLLPEIVHRDSIVKEYQSRIPVNRSKSWDRLDDNPRKNSTFVACPGKLGMNHTSNSLPSLSNPFPRRVPAALLAAINERLGPDIHPDDTVVVEMSSENIGSKMRHAFTVQEIREVVTRYEEQAGRKVKPIPLEHVLDPDEDGPITFEIRHGKEKNVFRLPAAKLKDNKKWFLHYCLWPVGRYILSMGQEQAFDMENVHWEEIQLSNRAVLMLPPNFWT